MRRTSTARTTAGVARCKSDALAATRATNFLREAITSCCPLPQAIQTLQKAQELGMRVLRMWAFADGPNEWNGLQPELHMLDEEVLTCAIHTTHKTQPENRTFTSPVLHHSFRMLHQAQQLHGWSLPPETSSMIGFLLEAAT